MKLGLRKLIREHINEVLSSFEEGRASTNIFIDDTKEIKKEGTENDMVFIKNLLGNEYKIYTISPAILAKRNLQGNFFPSSLPNELKLKLRWGNTKGDGTIDRKFELDPSAKSLNNIYYISGIDENDFKKIYIDFFRKILPTHPDRDEILNFLNNNPDKFKSALKPISLNDMEKVNMGDYDYHNPNYYIISKDKNYSEYENESLARKESKIISHDEFSMHRHGTARAIDYEELESRETATRFSLNFQVKKKAKNSDELNNIYMKIPMWFPKSLYQINKGVLIIQQWILEKNIKEYNSYMKGDKKITKLISDCSTLRKSTSKQRCITPLKNRFDDANKRMVAEQQFRNKIKNIIKECFINTNKV